MDRQMALDRTMRAIQNIYENQQKKKKNKEEDEEEEEEGGNGEKYQCMKLANQNKVRHNKMKMTSNI